MRYLPALQSNELMTGTSYDVSYGCPCGGVKRKQSQPRGATTIHPIPIHARDDPKLQPAIIHAKKNLPSKTPI